jgi:sarcosine oxidase subunit gamma
MTTLQPLSPLHEVARAIDVDTTAILGLADLSQRARVGVKGPGAADWLAGFGLALPVHPNSWTAFGEDGLIARLGMTEYLIEGDAETLDRLARAGRQGGVYPVLRQDAAIALCGVRVNELLLQVCSIDFRTLGDDPSKVVLTSMAGVGVTVLARRFGVVSGYQIWCDGTYGIYLWETLIEIAKELGGGRIGLNALLEQPSPNS